MKNVIMGALLVGLLLLAGTAHAGAVPVIDFSQNANAPSGIRRNNPGNIRVPATWTPVGAIGQSNGFVVFGNYLNGLAAMIYLIKSRYLDNGYDTIRTIGYRYAPPADNNDTEAWIQTVSQVSGIPPTATVGPAQLRALIHGIAAIENGAAWGTVAYDNFNAAYTLYQNNYA